MHYITVTIFHRGRGLALGVWPGVGRGCLAWGRGLGRRLQEEIRETKPRVN